MTQSYRTPRGQPAAMFDIARTPQFFCSPHRNVIRIMLLWRGSAHPVGAITNRPRASPKPVILSEREARVEGSHVTLRILRCGAPKYPNLRSLTSFGMKKAARDSSPCGLRMTELPPKPVILSEREARVEGSHVPLRILRRGAPKYLKPEIPHFVQNSDRSARFFALRAQNDRSSPHPRIERSTEASGELR